MRIKRFVVFVSSLGITACVSEPPTADYSRVQSVLDERLPEAAITRESTADSEARVQELLSQPLTPVSAMQIALLKNAGLRAELANIGIAQTDVVQASLISNPTLVSGIMQPQGGGRWQLDFGLSQSLLDVITRPLRQSLAQAEYEHTQLEVAATLNDVLQNIQRDYYAAIAAQHKASALETIAQSAETSSELTRRFRDAGNVSEQQYLMEDAESKQQRLVADTAATDAKAMRHELAKDLGVADEAELNIPELLPDMVSDQMDLEQLMQTAIKNRLDLHVLLHEQQVSQQILALEKKQRGISEVDIGAQTERDFDGMLNQGADLSITLPVFDQGQARIAAANEQLQQNQERVQELRAVIPHEVAQAYNDMLAIQARVQQLHEQILPQRERIIDLMQKQYKLMLVSTTDLLQAKRQQYEANLDYVTELGNYWQARSLLTKVVGGYLPDMNAADKNSLGEFQ